MTYAVLHKTKIRVVYDGAPPKLTPVGRTIRRQNKQIGTYLTIDVNAYNLWELRKFQIPMNEALEEIYEGIFNITPPERRDVPPFIKNDLHPTKYQMDGVRFIESRRGRFLLGDEMGLGKTLQVIMWLAAYPELRPAIVVCPAHLKYNWDSEISKFYGLTLNHQVLSTMRPYITYGDILIINYDILSPWVKYLSALKPQVLVMDEGHFIKNPKANRSKACRVLSEIAPHVGLLSGTPIENDLIELYSIMQYINPHVLGGLPAFKQEYMMERLVPVREAGTGAIRRRANGSPVMRTEAVGSKSTGHLHKVLNATVMLRRRKVDVLPQLPPKRHTIIPLEIEYKDYVEAEKALVAKLAEDGTNVTAQTVFRYKKLFVGLRQLAARAKLPQSINWIESFMRESTEKLIVIYRHRVVSQELTRSFPDALLIDGGVQSAEKHRRVDIFQNDKSRRLIFGEISSIGTGYTLTAASTVLFVELPEKPSTLDQAMDRAHRIGQMADRVDVYYHIAQNTVEQDLMSFIDRKRQLAVSVLDGEELQERDMLSSMFSAILQRHKSKNKKKR